VESEWQAMQRIGRKAKQSKWGNGPCEKLKGIGTFDGADMAG
jgi:hypothetical protein